MTNTMTPYEQAIADFLNKGGSIAQIPAGTSSPTVGQNAWGKPRAAAPKDITDIDTDSDE